MLIVFLQSILRGWVIDIDFIIGYYTVKIKRASDRYWFYYNFHDIEQRKLNFWYFILNVWVLFGSMLCRIMVQLRPKMGISLQFVFGFYLFLLILCVPVHENHKRFQGLNPTTTIYFPVRHNINNKHGEKPNKKLRKKVVLVRFQSWTCL